MTPGAPAPTPPSPTATAVGGTARRDRRCGARVRRPSGSRQRATRRLPKLPRVADGQGGSPAMLRGDKICKYRNAFRELALGQTTR
ncbi:hypothetical protein Tco_0528670 [Tanacetum coccineum]